MSDGQRRSSIQRSSETCTCLSFSDRQKAFKNLIGVCSSFTAVHGAFVGQLYLQSSVNADEGVGLISSALVYSVSVMFLFLCPTVNCLIGSKYSLLLGYILLFPYTLANYYPRAYTLYPASVLAGVAAVLIFANAQIHITAIANRYAPALKEKSEDAIVLFAGIFGLAIKLAQITGSIISSFSLLNFQNSVTEISDNATCINDEVLSIEQGVQYYSLVSAYLVLGIIGTIIGFTTIDHLGTESVFLSASAVFREHLVGLTAKTLKFFLINWKIRLLFPLFVLNGLSLGFTIGTYAKFYVSDCVGIGWIGFVTVANSLASAVAGVTMGRLYRYIPGFIIVYLAVFLAIGLSLFLIFVERSPNLYSIFGFAIGWGICDGAWQGFVSGIVGALFTTEKETAFTIFIMGVSVGFIISFVSALFISAVSQLWLIFSVVVVSAITYTVLTVTLKIMPKKQAETETNKELEEM